MSRVPEGSDVLVTLGPGFRELQAEDLDREAVRNFHCGDQPWETKVARHLNSGDALKTHNPPKKRTLLYCDAGGEGEVIGFVEVVKKTVGYPEFLGKQRVPCLLIAHLAVASHRQGEGHARRTISTLVEEAILDDLEAIYLLVDDRNTRAIEVYKRLGFVPFVDTEPFIDPEDGSRNIRLVLPLR